MHSHCHPHQHQQPVLILQRQKMFRFHPTACTASHRHMGCGCCVAWAPRAAGPSATGLGCCMCQDVFAGTIVLTSNPAGRSKAGSDSIFQHTVGSEKALSYQRTGAGVNLIMIKPIFFLLNTEEEADGHVLHRFFFFFLIRSTTF